MIIKFICEIFENMEYEMIRSIVCGVYLWIVICLGRLVGFLFELIYNEDMFFNV